MSKVNGSTEQPAETFQAAAPLSPLLQLLHSCHNFRMSINLKFPLKTPMCQLYYLWSALDANWILTCIHVILLKAACLYSLGGPWVCFYFCRGDTGKKSHWLIFRRFMVPPHAPALAVAGELLSLSGTLFPLVFPFADVSCPALLVTVVGGLRVSWNVLKSFHHRLRHEVPDYDGDRYCLCLPSRDIKTLSQVLWGF